MENNLTNLSVLLGTRKECDLKQKAKCMKRINLQMKKKLFDAKLKGDMHEAQLIEQVLLPRLIRSELL